MTAIKESDFQTAKAECIRKYKDSKDGQYKPLQKRNREFIQTFFDSGLFNEGQQEQMQIDTSSQVPQQNNSWNHQNPEPAYGQFQYKHHFDQEFLDRNQQLKFKQSFPKDYTTKNATNGKAFRHLFQHILETLRLRE